MNGACGIIIALASWFVPVVYFVDMLLGYLVCACQDIKWILRMNSDI